MGSVGGYVVCRGLGRLMLVCPGLLYKYKDKGLRDYKRWRDDKFLSLLSVCLLFVCLLLSGMLGFFVMVIVEKCIWWKLDYDFIENVG